MTPTVTTADFAAAPAPARTRSRGSAAPARAPRRAPRTAPRTTRRPHLRVVDTPAQRAGLSQRRLVWVAGLTVLALLTVVVFQVLLAQSAIARDRLQQRTAAAEQRYAQERLDHANLVAPARVEREAKRLGLVPAAQPPTPVPVDGEVVSMPHATTTGLDTLKELKPTLSAP